MKFLCNTYDPKRPDAKRKAFCMVGETQEQAWERRKRWLSDKVLGLPQVADTPDAFTVQELIRMGMVGVYLPDEEEVE